jgi:hypothetical protein
VPAAGEPRPEEPETAAPETGDVTPVGTPDVEPDVKADVKPDVKPESKPEVEVGAPKPAEKTEGDRPSGFREPAGIERGKPGVRVPSQMPRRGEAAPAAAVPAPPVQAAAAVTPAPPKPAETAPAAPQEVHGLRRRVRGAQLPDTGPEAPTEPAPERTAEGVRSALASFAAGRKNAAKKPD